MLLQLFFSSVLQFSLVQHSACCQIEAAGRYSGHRCWVPAELSRSKEPGAACSKRRKIPLQWKGSGLKKGLDFLPDRQRLENHNSRYNFAIAEWQRSGPLQHAAELSKVQRALNSDWERSRPGACCFTQPAETAPPGPLHETPLQGGAESSQCAGSSSCLIVSSSGQGCLVCIKANHSLQDLSRHAARKHYYPRAGRVSVFFSFT